MNLRVYQHVFSKSYEMYKLMENLNYFRMERISVSFGGEKKLGGSWIGFFYTKYGPKSP